MPRVIALDAIDDKAFGSKIDFGEQFDLTLVADLSYAAQPLGHQSSGIARSLHGKIEQVLLSLAVIRLFLIAVDQFWLAGSFAFRLTPDELERIDVAALTLAIFDLLVALLFS